MFKKKKKKKKRERERERERERVNALSVLISIEIWAVAKLTNNTNFACIPFWRQYYLRLEGFWYELTARFIIGNSESQKEWPNFLTTK